jgi:HSP20 family molecular chaperone IbpA
MSAEEKNITPRGRVTVERVLLTAVLVLQACILLMLAIRSPSPDRQPLGPPGATPDAQASRRDLSSVRASRSDPVWPVAPVVVAQRPAVQSFEEARRMFAQMDRMFERAMGDLEEMGPRFTLDDGWDRLAAMPAIDLRERPADYRVVMTVPDASLNGADIRLDGRLLSLDVSVPSGRDPSDGLLRYRRQILLPGPVGDPMKARAFVTNGVLHVIVPKGTPSDHLSAPVRLR